MKPLRSEVRPSDVEAVRSLTAATGFFHESEVRIAAELVEERLERGLASGYHFFFAEGDGAVEGYACFGPIDGTLHSFDLFWICVEPSRQGHGLGRALLAASEAEIAAMGGRRIYVETSDKASYEPTRGFYRRCGYRQEGRLEDFYAPGDGKVFFVKVVAGA